MNDDMRADLARGAAMRLDALATALRAKANIDDSTVMDRMRDLQGPLRAKSYDTGARSLRSDATANAAAAADQAVRDERDLNRYVREASMAAAAAWKIIGRYPAPRRPNPAEQAAVGRLNARGELFCQSCARTTDSTGQARYEPIRPASIGPTTVGGRLNEALGLCSWCYGCVRDWSRLPTPAEVDLHHRGVRVRWPDDVERPA